jgi:hypothetical protein
MPKRKRQPGEPRRKPGLPEHVPTKTGRDMVSVMVAGGIGQEDVARSLSISENTLRKHYRAELDSGATSLNTMVIIEHVKRIKAGDFQAIKWWQQARMGWSERIVVDDGKPADTPMRVVVEFVGEAGAPRAEQAVRTGPRMADDVRKNVQLVG